MAEERFEIVGDVVRDHVTGLEWQRTPAGPMTWHEAVAHAAGLGDGWWLPTVAEHITMINYERQRPATDFPGETGFWYWSSSSCAGSGSTAWYVNFAFGLVCDLIKTDPNHVRCVRSGRDWGLGPSDRSREPDEESCDECGHPPARGNVVYEDSGRRPLCTACNAPDADEPPHLREPNPVADWTPQRCAEECDLAAAEIARLRAEVETLRSAPTNRQGVSRARPEEEK